MSFVFLYARLARFDVRAVGMLAFALVVLVPALACGSSAKGKDAGTPGVRVETATSPATPPGWVDQLLKEPPPPPTPPPYDGEVARVSIPRLEIDYPIEVLDILPGGQMDTPHAANTRIGWYHDFPKPGFGKNAIFSAHETYNRANGPFRYLRLAQPGDEVDVTMDDGSIYTYTVFSNLLYDVDAMPMQDIIYPSNQPKNEEWVTLITCGGRFVPIYGNGLGEYLDRYVVVAKRPL